MRSKSMNNLLKVLKALAGAYGLFTLVAAFFVAKHLLDTDLPLAEKTRTKATSLVVHYLKEQELSLVERDKFADNINELQNTYKDAEEFKSRHNGEYQVKTWSKGNSAIIHISSSSSKNKNYFGIIKILESKTIEKTGAKVFTSFSFVCVSSSNSLDDKINFDDIISKANAKKRNNCPTKYSQTYPKEQ
jgi:hypothetical protein